MKGPKGSLLHYIVVFTMVSMWLSGCVSDDSDVLISSINDNNHIIDINTIVPYIPQITIPQAGMNISEPINCSERGKIIYKRNYNDEQKGSYSGFTYQVKHGDTLFYIAWITGNDYQDLAKKNNILAPYNLKVGQLLKVNTKLVPNKVNNLTNNMLNAITTSSVNTQRAKSSIDLNKNNKLSKKLGQPIIGKSTGESAIINCWHWPTDGKIIDGFSTKEGGNKGIDISGVLGQPIFAAASGKVVYAGNALQGYGNLIIIKHNNDYLSAYAHNDTILVSERQEIKKGQKIATMGNSGAHSVRLHFEIRYKGKSVNPLQYLPRRQI